MLRESTSTQGDGDYTTAQDTSSVVTDTSYSVIKQNTDFTVQQGRKIARKQIEKYRERRSAEQTETIRVHTANERGVSPKQVECSTLSDAERHPRRGADLPRQRAKEKVVTAKTAPRDIRGVTQGQRQLRTAANETVRSITTQAQMQTRTRQVQLAIQKAASSTRAMKTKRNCSGQKHARQYGIFLSACTVLSRPLLQGLAWHSVLLLSSALWPLCPARPMASFLPPMPPTPTQLPCNRQ